MLKKIFLYCLAILSLLVIFSVPSFADNADNSSLVKYKIETSKHFTKRVDESTGVEVYYLETGDPNMSTRAFYYVHTGFSADMRYYWFLVEYKSAIGTYYPGVIDFASDELTIFNEINIGDDCAVVNEETGDLIYCENRRTSLDRIYRVYKKSPDKDSAPVLLNAVPAFESNATYWPKHSLATHFTFNSDKTAIGMDSGTWIRNQQNTYVGIIPLDGSAVEVWAILDRCYDHGQLNPVRNDLLLVCQDNFKHTSKQEGYSFSDGIDNRMWLVWRNGKVEPVFTQSNKITHEWWDTTGDYIWYIDRDGGTVKLSSSGIKPKRVVCKVNVDTRVPEMVWYTDSLHAFCDTSGKYLVSDYEIDMGRGGARYELADTKIVFYNTITNREVIVEPQKMMYSEHGHPSISPKNDYVVYNIQLEKGRAQIAFSPMNILLEASNDPERSTLLELNYLSDETESADIPSNASRFEAETLPVSGNQKSYPDNVSSASGKQIRRLKASGIGDYMEYTTQVSKPGNYLVKVCFKEGNDCGIYSVKMDGTRLGSNIDLKGDRIYELELGIVKIDSAGNVKFQFTCEGKNDASSGYILRIDYIQLELQE